MIENEWDLGGSVMNTKAVSDMERNNRTAMYCHLFEALIIAGTFISEFMLGNRTILYALIVVVLAMGPVIASYSCTLNSPFISSR